MVTHNGENYSILSLRLGKVGSDWLETQTFIETAELFIIRVEASASADLMPLECRPRQLPRVIMMQIDRMLHVPRSSGISKRDIKSVFGKNLVWLKINIYNHKH
jgi:hypothetical protein